MLHLLITLIVLPVAVRYRIGIVNLTGERVLFVGHSLFIVGVVTDNGGRRRSRLHMGN